MIGVFDSGVGGLSVLKALRAELPHEDFLYFADTAHAPYGERGDAYVADRTRTVVEHLRSAHAVKALVIACNTATAAAIHLVRAEHPDLPLVGVEPALKPAVAASRTKRIGVLATRGTLASEKFKRLHQSMGAQADFRLQPCDGLADAIEAQDTGRIAHLCAHYANAVGALAAGEAQTDVLVLGCTHYPFAADVLACVCGPDVKFIDTGTPVARQARRLLASGGLLRGPTAGTIHLDATGSLPALRAAVDRWL